MPTIRPQRPNQTRAAPVTNGPPVRQTADDGWGDDYIRMLLYGASGTGKTTLAATFPGPILWAICSGSVKSGELRSVKTPEYRRKITPMKIGSTEDYAAFIAKLASGGWGTGVLDHGSGLADMKLKEILGIDELPAQKTWGLVSQQQYGQLALQCKESFRAILNLACNSVVICQERTFGEEGASDLIQPTVGAALTPSVTGWLNPACDYVVQTFKRPVMEKLDNVVGGKTITTWRRGKGVEYCLRCEQHDVYMTKFRRPNKAPLENIVNPTYEKIVALING